MSRNITHDDTRLDSWILEFGLRDTPLQHRLRDATAGLPEAQMQVSADEGQVLAFLARLVGARRALEIGTFTGYSSLAVAQALPAGGRLVACDISETFTRTARHYWAEAGLSDRIELRLGPAVETLVSLESEVGPRYFDFAFIDADKENYDAYYEACLRLVRHGGLIAIDNTLWSGAVADPDDVRPSTVALRALARKIRAVSRVDMCLLTISDGVTLVRPR